MQNSPDMVDLCPLNKTVIMRRKINLTLILFFIYGVSITVAQTNSRTDTVSLSINDAEALFLKNNFFLLSEKYKVNEAEAAIVQAKLWDNPVLNIDKEAYNEPSGKWFIIPNGEYAMSLQQLIYLAGKKNKRVSIEKINSRIAQYQFYDLIRTLRFELRTTFYELYFSQKSLSIYDMEIAALRLLTEAYSVEYQKGNVPFKELARLQALQFSLENEKIDLLRRLNEKQGNLIILTGDTLSRPIKPVLNISAIDSIESSSMDLGFLFDQGFKNRFDLKISESQIQAEEINLTLQKALRVPDMTLGATYDRVAGYIPNYNSLTLSFNLPLWNFNQGNIKISQNRIEETKVLKNQKELEVRTDITNAYTQFLETERLYKSSLQKFDVNYDRLFDGITTGYKNHSISLLEFIDYYQTFKNSKTEYYQLQVNRLEALENLNMATGTIIFK
jgi:cobalt-zinc-cadmium efflux system outer membrane protein